MEIKSVTTQIEQATNRHIARFISGMVYQSEKPQDLNRIIIKSMWNLSNDIVAILQPGGSNEPVI